MKLSRAALLLYSSACRLKKLQGIQDNEENKNERLPMLYKILRRESWINFKRSWDVWRIVCFTDKRTRFSLVETAKRFLRL